jgi:hyperosmotically inducible protein
MRYALKLVSAMLLTAAVSVAVAGDRTVGETIDDTVILTKVETALLGNDAMAINVEMHDGVALLAGFLDSQQAKQDALEAVQRVEGVTGIRDHIYVQDHPRMAGQVVDDSVIAGKIKAELAASDDTEALEINVEVDDGVVLLSGWVDSEDEAESATLIARSIVGVEKIIDGMEVAAS